MKPSDDPFANAALEDAAPPQELGKRIVSECTRDLAPARGLSRGLRWAITLTGAAAVCSVLLSARLASGAHWSDALPVMLIWAAGLAMASVLLLLRPPGRRPSLYSCIAVVVVGVLAFFVYVGSLGDEASSLLVALTTRTTWNCGLYAGATGSVTVLLLMLAWRRTDPMSPGLTGAFLGLCGGVAAGLAAATVCPIHEAWHLYLGHGVALALTVAGAGWVGRRWLAP